MHPCSHGVTGKTLHGGRKRCIHQANGPLFDGHLRHRQAGLSWLPVTKLHIQRVH